MTDRELTEQAYAESLEEPLDKRILATIEDIKGIVAVLDPEGYEWAEEEKAKRERREHENQNHIGNSKVAVETVALGGQ